ncbi:S-adenosyl-L-methionine-dependent methyltransferase [Nemania sp. FL0916]|nr:S-adenosyl-L-methionine-dependent methyltransferase [Nemania sp. FL0916]
MSAPTTDNPNPPASAHENLGFTSPRGGVDWSEYSVYRPIYQPSFFNRIYSYHSSKPSPVSPSWSIAHDVGAGHGIVSSSLAAKFSRVIVSEPNPSYSATAQELLIHKAGWPEDKFAFLNEGAEKSFVEDASVDLITACECLHFADSDAAMENFARELKPGGTLVVTYYAQPTIVGNEAAQEIWRRLYRAFADREISPVFTRALRVASSGYDAVGIPAGKFEGVKRVYVNASKGIASFLAGDVAAESKVGEGEERVWVHGDKDWCDDEGQGVEYFKKYIATWIPPIPEDDVKDLWDEMERVLDGGKVRTETPLVMLLATRRA